MARNPSKIMDAKDKKAVAAIVRGEIRELKTQRGEARRALAVAKKEFALKARELNKISKEIEKREARLPARNKLSEAA